MAAGRLPTPLGWLNSDVHSGNTLCTLRHTAIMEPFCKNALGSSEICVKLFQSDEGAKSGHIPLMFFPVPSGWLDVFCVASWVDHEGTS